MAHVQNVDPAMTEFSETGQNTNECQMSKTTPCKVDLGPRHAAVKPLHGISKYLVIAPAS